MLRQTSTALIFAVLAGCTSPSFSPPPTYNTSEVRTKRFVPIDELGGEGIYDRETGLTWRKSPGPVRAWADAVHYCYANDWGGPGNFRQPDLHTKRYGWRLPTIEELGTLFRAEYRNSTAHFSEYWFDLPAGELARFSGEVVARPDPRSDDPPRRRAVPYWSITTSPYASADAYVFRVGRYKEHPESFDPVTDSPVAPFAKATYQAYPLCVKSGHGPDPHPLDAPD